MNATNTDNNLLMMSETTCPTPLCVLPQYLNSL